MVRSRALGSVAALCLACVVMLLAFAASASAQTSMNTAVDIPSTDTPVVVGQSYASDLTIRNDSTSTTASLNVTINPSSIQLVPSCGTQPVGGTDCPPASYDPGVFTLIGPGTGSDACAGITFTITPLASPTGEGRYEFQPSGPVVLGPSSGSAASATCLISYTAHVVRAPALNSNPTPGGPLETAQVAFATGVASNGVSGSGGGNGLTTVTSATPTMTTAVSPTPITLGQTFTDTATITGVAGSPAPTGTVSFSVFDNATCTGTPALTSTGNPVSTSAGLTSATSGAFLPTHTGSYYVVATYSGDANYGPLVTACGATAETDVVTPATPTIVTKVSPAQITLGQSFTDTATLTGPAGAAPPTGTVSFGVFNNSTCSGTPVLTSAGNAISTTGGVTSATSGAFTPTSAGTYYVIATYGGDANYAALTTACGATGETEVVIPPPVGITTLAAVASGGKLSDVATLGPVAAGAPAPTGNVTFDVYGPTDTTCSQTPVFTSTDPVTTTSSGTTATSAVFSAPGPGTYRFVAVYGGDSNYPSLTSPCNAANESVTLPMPVIGVTKAASPPSEVAPGGTFTFTVTVSNPSTIDPITITSLVDNIYGNLATRPGSTCGALIGVTLAPGATSAPCSFTGPFTGSAGQSQTDTVTVGGVDSNGFTATATAMATVTLTPAAPQIAVTKAASPLSLPAPGGTFKFTVTVSNPSTLTPVTITALTDNIYGNLVTRPGSTCGALIGVTLAPGATSAPCSFTGTFDGASGASQTDTVTVTGTNNGTTVTATAKATVKLTPAPVTLGLPAALHGPSGCVRATSIKLYVTGADIKSVSYSLDGKHLATVTKKDAEGRYVVTVKTGGLSYKVHHLVAVVKLKTGKSKTVRSDVERCQPAKLPLFTG